MISGAIVRRAQLKYWLMCVLNPCGQSGPHGCGWMQVPHSFQGRCSYSGRQLWRGFCFLDTSLDSCYFPWYFWHWSNNLQSTYRHEGGPQKVIFHFLKISYFPPVASQKWKWRTINVILSSVQLCPENKLQVWVSFCSVGVTKGTSIWTIIGLWSWFFPKLSPKPATMVEQRDSGAGSWLYLWHEGRFLCRLPVSFLPPSIPQHL